VCEVLAVAFAEPRPFAELREWALALERLGSAGEGWGVAWRDGDRVSGYRNPIPMAEDAAGVARLSSVHSDRFLVHLRKPSEGFPPLLADTQPFVEPDGSFAFCHNGYLERHAEHRSAFAIELHGQADSEVGFRFFASRLREGEEPGRALALTHEVFGGRANLGYLDRRGSLLVNAAHPANPMWRFRVDGAHVACTAIHRDDESLFNDVFPDALERRRVQGTAPVA
jgi:predicted glutamine amidotransferase